jgi:hypothetical protein
MKMVSRSDSAPTGLPRDWPQHLSLSPSSHTRWTNQWRHIYPVTFPTPSLTSTHLVRSSTVWTLPASVTTSPPHHTPNLSSRYIDSTFTTFKQLPLPFIHSVFSIHTPIKPMHTPGSPDCGTGFRMHTNGRTDHKCTALHSPDKCDNGCF